MQPLKLCKTANGKKTGQRTALSGQRSRWPCRGRHIADGRMGAMVSVGAPLITLTAICTSSGGIERPNPIPLWLRTSPGRRHLLPKPHQVSSHTLCQGPSGVLHPSPQRGEQHALLSHPRSHRRRWDVSGSSIQSVCYSGRRQHGVVRRTRLLDKQYHAERTRLACFAWFRRKQQLHFVHHVHANCNFAVIDFFWDKVLGTYRNPDTNIR